MEFASDPQFVDPKTLPEDIGKMYSNIPKDVRLQEDKRSDAQHQFMFDYLAQQDPELAYANVLRDLVKHRGPLQGATGSAAGTLGHVFTTPESMLGFAEERYPLLGFGQEALNRVIGTKKTIRDPETGKIRTPDWDETAEFSSAENLTNYGTMSAQIQALKDTMKASKATSHAKPLQIFPSTYKHTPGTFRKNLAKKIPGVLSSKVTNAFPLVSAAFAVKGAVAPSREQEQFSKDIEEGNIPSSAGVMAAAFSPGQATALGRKAYLSSRDLGKETREVGNQSAGVLANRRAQGLISEKQYQKGIADLQKQEGSALSDARKDVAQSIFGPATKAGKDLLTSRVSPLGRAFSDMGKFVKSLRTGGARAHSPQGTRGRRK